MKTIKQLSCGECGGGRFEIYMDIDEDTCGLDAHTHLIIECLECGSMTEVKPFKPLLRVEGSLCRMND